MIALRVLGRLPPVLFTLLFRNKDPKLSLLFARSTRLMTTASSSSTASSDAKPAGSSISWTPLDPEQREQAKESLEVWPLDEYNAKLLNEVHPLGYRQSTPHPHEVYDLIGTCRKNACPHASERWIV
jgi:hypothetical protein